MMAFITPLTSLFFAWLGHPTTGAFFIQVAIGGISYIAVSWAPLVVHSSTVGSCRYTGACSEAYLEKAFDNTGLRPKKRLVNAKELGKTSLIFLIHPTLKKKEINQTCDAITSAMKLATK